MKQFEDLPVWQAGRELVKTIYALTRRSPFCRDSGLCDQIQRAAVSVPSNIAEGHERGSTADLIQFLFYAKGSAGEVRSQLYHAEDVGYLPPDEAEKVRESCAAIARQISSWVQSMQNPNFKGGPKFHKEPDRRWERFSERAGFTRMPDGRYVRRNEERNTEDGTGTANGGTGDQENAR